MNRQCTYSPARRVGRPHAVRESAQTQNQKRSKLSSRSRRNSLQPSFRALESPNPSNPTESRVPDPAGIPRRTESVVGFDNNTCFPDTHTLSFYADNQSAEIQSSPCDFLNTRLDTDATKTDCTTVALSIVEQLGTSKRWSDTASTYGAGGLTTTEACRRLLTILVCPCSEQAEVALLVASACISLMDVVHGSFGANSHQGSPSLSLVSHGLFEQQDLSRWPRPQSSAPSSSSSDGQSQVGDLAKIAKVIQQFTDKYCQDTKEGGPRWEHTGWVVAPVAALLRCRLQSVTQGATRRLVS
ncbi:MAG: hypothetical protein Q9203_004764 [Teloschistes exilis]